MIKHKQNKKTSGIYSLPLKCDLCSTFGIKQKKRLFLDRCRTGSWCQPVWGRHSGDIRSKKGEIQLATCWDYNHVLVFLQFRY